MNDNLLIQLEENPSLKNDDIFCYQLSSALHTFYVANNNYESRIMKIIGKSKLNENLVLMPKQLDFINKITKEDYLVLSAPTSFGKSFLVLEYIKRLTSPLKLIVYVVHTKALADEVYNNMSNYFGKIYNVIDDLDNFDENAYNIAVVISDGKNMFNFNKRVDFLIVDEAYNLDKQHSKDRFLTIYNCYRILMNNANKVLLLGPFIKNLIGPEANKYKFYKTNYSPVTSRIKEYNIDTYNNPSSKFIEKVVGNENTIGFINSRPKIYEEMTNILESTIEDSYNDDFIQWMEGYFPDYWMLPKLMKKRIGIYHSAFPKYINLYNLKKFNDGTFKGLLTTSAILEGVNTSAKNIVIYGTKYNEAELTPFQFYNLCGRAGRLNREIVGNIYNYGESYESLYNQRTLSLYIGDSPSNPNDRFDEGIEDDDTEVIKNHLINELSKLGIIYENWYDEYKFYFHQSVTLLNLIDIYNNFKEDFKIALNSTLLKKNSTDVNKNEIIKYIYEKFIKLTNYKFMPHCRFNVVPMIQELLNSKNKGIYFNLKMICESSLIKNNIDNLEKIAEKNQYIVEIMRTGYDYIPYDLFYISLILNEFIKYDPFFSKNEKDKFKRFYFDRILIYLKSDDSEKFSKLLSDRGVIPPLIDKILIFFINEKIDIRNFSRKDFFKAIKENIENIKLTEYEKINLENVHFV